MIAAAVLGALVLALVAHEGGHVLAASVLRLPWRLVLTRYGPGVEVGSDALRLERWQVVLTAAAGPLANVALAGVAYGLGLGLVVLVSVELAAVSLLPLGRSDGARMVRPGRAIARASAGLR